MNGDGAAAPKKPRLVDKLRARLLQVRAEKNAEKAKGYLGQAVNLTPLQRDPSKGLSALALRSGGGKVKAAPQSDEVVQEPDTNVDDDGASSDES